MPNLYAVADKTWTRIKPGAGTGSASWSEGDCVMVFPLETITFIPKVMEFHMAGVTATKYGGFASAPQKCPVTAVLTLKGSKTSVQGPKPNQCWLKLDAVTTSTFDSPVLTYTDGQVWNRKSSWQSLTRAPGDQVAHAYRHGSGSALWFPMAAGPALAGDSLVAVAKYTPTADLVLEVGAFIPTPTGPPTVFLRTGMTWAPITLNAVSKTFALPTGASSPSSQLWTASSALLNEPKRWNGSAWVSAGSDAHYYDGAKWVRA